MRVDPAPLVLAVAALLAGCVIDPYDDPVPGVEARVYLHPGAPPAEAAWPASYRRGAVFVIENRTGAPVETILFDLSGRGHPRELIEATIEDPPGHRAEILQAPHGTWPLRALLGVPGTTLLEPGAGLRLLVRVKGEPGVVRARVTVPGVTPD